MHPKVGVPLPYNYPALWIKFMLVSDEARRFTEAHGGSITCKAPVAELDLPLPPLCPNTPTRRWK